MTTTVVTLTLNPTLDVLWAVDSVVPADKLRVDPLRTEPGGGGVNVSRVCQRFGQPTLAVVALGGPTGDEVETLLADSATPYHRLPITDTTRRSTTVLDRTSALQYRFVLPGPTLTPDELATTTKAVVDHATTPDQNDRPGWVVVSGSMPGGVEAGFLAELASTVGGDRMVVDTSGPALPQALDAGVALVKPSVKELEAVVGQDLETEAEVITAVDTVLARSNVGALVASLGSGGAVVATQDGQRYRVRAPAVRVRSAVGAGDSMVAGMAVALANGSTVPEAVANGVAAGTAAVMTEGTELCRAEDHARLHPLVSIEPCN